ncbi:hypothetical protein DIPPA_08776 [Diplonema papillatum]|nr:hypothetical protein DIPPA_08776 [Diplonema papillatum]
MPGKKDKKKNKEVEPEVLKPDTAEYDNESLKVKIATYEMKIMRLHRENVDLKEKIDKALAEMTDSTAQSLEMFQRLTDRMDSKDKDIGRMRSEASAIEDERNKLEADLRMQLTLEKEDRDALVERMKQEAASLQQQLDDVEQFRQQKDAMVRKIDGLEATIAELRASHVKELDSLQEVHKEERERLRTDMIRKWRKTRLEVYKLTEDHLQTKTQQTIQENEKLTQDLDTYAREVRDMMFHNTKLVEENAALKRSIEIEEHSVAELMRKSQKQQRAIRNLVQKLKGFEDVHRKSQYDKDADSMQRITGLGETIDNQYDIILELKDELDGVYAKLREAEKGFHDQIQANGHQMLKLTEVQHFLIQCADDVHQQAALCSSKESPLSTLSPAARGQAVDYMLRRLKCFETGFFPKPPAAIEDRAPRNARMSMQIDDGVDEYGNASKLPLIVPHAESPSA